MTDIELLAEIEDILSSAPSRETAFNVSVENYCWLGRAMAALEECDIAKDLMAEIDNDAEQSTKAYISEEGLRKVFTAFHQTRHNLLVKATGRLSIAVSNGMFFDYFDEIREIIKTANRTILFVDPYLDAEFVSRYITHVRKGVSIRLLAREKLDTLLPAVNAYRNQSQQAIQVRSASRFDDRYVFIDGDSCYRSGAIFTAGMKENPTTVTQITSAFTATYRVYEDIWQYANVEFK